MQEIMEVLQGLGFPRNCFAFPSAIERKDLPRLHQVPYMVSEKSDGVRYLLAIFGGVAKLIGRNLKSIDVKLDVQGGTIGDDCFLLDGELVSLKKDPGSKLFVVYDALLTSRGRVANQPLPERRSALKDDFFGTKVWKLVLPHGKRVEVQLKEMVPMEGGLSYYREVVPHLRYRSDGLIFTPVNEPIMFGTCPTLFKWKVLEANTVDFRVSADERCYVLSLMDRGREVQVARTSLQEGSLVKLMIDMDLSKGLRPIFECAWDPASQSWQPRKQRKDKSEPNSVMTFNATIKNLTEDVRLEDIFGAR